MSTIRIGIIGCGGITLQNHVPGIAMCGDLARITALCDNNPANLENVQKLTGAGFTTSNYSEVIERDDVDAVIIATPTDAHVPPAEAAIARGKHVFLEKPLALSHAEAKSLATKADAAKVVHMTGFTYQFVPAMRYFQHLVKQGYVGRPYHFRSARLQDWGARNLAWRQLKKHAGTGELGDMLSHRINFAHELVGDMRRIVAGLKQFVMERGGQPSDLDDWSALMVDFENDATGMMESTKLASGRNESWKSRDAVELNGAEGTIIYNTERWNELIVGKLGGEGVETIEVPAEFRTWPGSPRDPNEGNPLITFRYDQAFEFVDAIQNQRPAYPSFHHGVKTQAVIDAAVLSAEEKRWVEVAY